MSTNHSDSLPQSQVTSHSREEQIAPGVYFTRAPTATPVDAFRDTRPLSEYSLPELEREKKELQNSVDKLISSNKEMREIDPDQQDYDLTLAVSENIAVIAKRRAKIRMIRKTLKDVFGKVDNHDDQDEDFEQQIMQTNNESIQNESSENENEGMYL